MCSDRSPIANRRGFSLVEIMIVIVIIGLLATAVTYNVRNYLTKAKQNVARQDITVLMNALDRFWADNGRYPTNDEGLAVLSRKTDKNPEPLLAKEPLDPWGKPYTYSCPGSNPNYPYEITCQGAGISSNDLTQKAGP
jgi:general secretion pathway protein G